MWAYLNLKLQETVDNYEILFDSGLIQPAKIFTDLVEFYR